ncbi:MAG: hypothetical protein NTX20_08315 [Verrucomicrobia bacterium]|nr:hypothetical protein [Verrucomicrobiota bacterium]
MSTEGKGMIGSIAVHAGIICALVAVSWLASRHEGQAVEAADPLLVDLNGIPGKRPGEIGKAAGVAQGEENGTKTGVKIVKIKKLDVEKIQEARAQAEAEAAAPAHATSKATAKTTPKASTGSGKTSLSDFMNAKGGKSSASGKVGGIGGVSVKKGRNFGTGDNGGEGGSATEQQLYAGEVLARFRSAWTEIISAEGGAISSAGSCGVTLSVDAGGTVSFSGWLSRPQDNHLAELVRRACTQIGNCGKPPNGRAFKIDFPKVGVSEG